MNDLRRDPLLTDTRLGEALAGIDGRTVVATAAMLEEPQLVPACDLLVVAPHVSAADGAVRLVRQVARRQPAPRIVVVGQGETEESVDALLAGADAWVDERAELSALVAALTGQVPTRGRRRWCRRR